MVTDEAERAAVGSVPTELYIGGRWRASRSERSFPVEDPSTEKVLIEVADAGPEDAEDALAAAATAGPAWAPHPPGSGPRSCAAPTRRWWPAARSWPWS